MGRKKVPRREQIDKLIQQTIDSILQRPKDLATSIVITDMNGVPFSPRTPSDGQIRTLPDIRLQSTPIFIKVASNPNKEQKFEHSLLDKILKRESKGNHVKYVEPEQFLNLLFPDSVLPMPIEDIYKGLLFESADDTGNSASAVKANAPSGQAGSKVKGKGKEVDSGPAKVPTQTKGINTNEKKLGKLTIKLKGQIRENSPNPWLFAPFSKAPKPYKGKLPTNEDLVSAFINRIAEGVKHLCPDLPNKFKARSSSGKFASVPLHTDVKIERKPDVVGARSRVISHSLQVKPPYLDWAYVHWILEHKLREYLGSDFVGLTIELLDKAFAIMVSTDNRRFVIIPSMTGCLIRVSFFDHGGAIHSTEFNMNEKPKLFLRLVVGLMFAPDSYLGLDPTLTYSPTADRVLLLGGEKYVVLKTLYRAPMVNGRATRIMLCLYKGRLVVVKDVWIYTHRNQNEVYFLLEAKAAGVKGIPTLVTWEDVMIDGRYDTTDRNRGKFKGLPDRTHRRVVFDGKCVPLEQFSDLYELFSVWIDIVTCLRDLRYKAKILHRDISLNNMMIDDTEVKYPRPGVLIDYDFSLDIDEERKSGKKPPLAPENAGSATAPLGLPSNNSKLAQEGHRTGTPPFMSWQVLLKPYKLHNEHDDIQSVFFVMLYFASVFTGPNAQQDKDSLPYFVSIWLYAKDMRTIALSKLGICNMTEEDFEEDILSFVTPYFRPMKGCLAEFQKRLDSRESKQLTHDELIEILTRHRAKLSDNAPDSDSNPFDQDDDLPPEFSQNKPPLDKSPLPDGIKIKTLVAEVDEDNSKPFHGAGKTGVESFVVTVDPLMSPEPPSRGARSEIPQADSIRLWSNMEIPGSPSDVSTALVSTPHDTSLEPSIANLFQSATMESLEFVNEYFGGSEEISRKKLKRMISKARGSNIPKPSDIMSGESSDIVRPPRERGFFSALLNHAGVESEIASDNSVYASARRIVPPTTGPFSSLSDETGPIAGSSHVGPNH